MMAGKHGVINKIGNDDHVAKTNMMDMWKASLERTQKNRQAAVGAAKSRHESKAELEQKVRNGQAECQTCAARTYRDESDDGGVSFQAARHINPAAAGTTVMNHEQEHVSANRSESGGDEVRSSTTALEYGKCPECGRTYVKGGVTKTTARPASYNKRFRRSGSLDVKA